MPEFYFHDSDQPSCTLRLVLRANSGTERKQFLLAIIDQAYVATQSWSKEYVVAGVDYVDFRYVHFISYHPCDESEELISRLGQAFGTDHADWTVADHTTLVSTFEELDKLGQVGVFIRYKSKAQVRDCLIRIPIAKLEAGKIAYNSFVYLRKRYRPPLADIDWNNHNLTLLLSRQCMQKRAIYDQLLFLLSRENRPTDILGSADFDPSPYEYFYTYQCQLGLSGDDNTCSSQ